MDEAGITFVTGQLEAAKAIGPIIFVEPKEFLALLERTQKPLVVLSPKKLLIKYRYLTSYKGLSFLTKSKEPLRLPSSAEIIIARKIVIPEI